MFNVYGERQSLVNPYQGVLAIFLGNLLRGEPLTIHGDGSQTRDFVYVRDVTDAWLRVLEDDRTAGRTYNVGTGVELSISQLADAALAAFGRTRDEWPVIRERPQRGDVTRSGADITLLTETVGWTPQTSLHDGLARTAAWARRQDGEDVA
jgi:UDP-glucose 4-epimerase